MRRIIRKRKQPDLYASPDLSVLVPRFLQAEYLKNLPKGKAADFLKPAALLLYTVVVINAALEMIYSMTLNNSDI